MDDYKLRVFCAVVETQSFSQASRMMNLSQPAVSLQMRALEEIYETVLFDRSDKHLKLTPAGELLYKHAKDILGLYGRAEKEINAMTGRVKGLLIIGASTTVGTYLLPDALVAFRRKYPRVDLRLLVGNTKAVVKMLNNGDVHLGIVEGDVSKENMVVEKLMEDELKVIFAADHPWARKKNISVLELIKEPFVIREQGSGTRQMIEKYLQAHKISLSDLLISLELANTEAIKTTVEQGMGVSIVSGWAVKKEIAQGILKATIFKDLRFLRDFTIIYPKRKTLLSTGTQFLDFLKIHTEKDGPP